MRFFRFIAITAIIITMHSSPLRAEEISVDAPASAQIGQPFVLKIMAPGGAKNVKVSWQGKTTMLSMEPAKGGGVYSALLGTDLKSAVSGPNNMLVSCEIDDILWEVEKKITLQKKEYPSEKLTVAPKMVNPLREQMERISREAKLSGAAIQTNVPGFAPKLPLVRPVPGKLTSVYGKSRYFNNELRSRHSGVDMRAAVGTPIKAAVDGTVVLTGDFWFSGKCVYISHGAGLVSFYGHMSKLTAKKGQEVKAGDVIGLSGQSGRVTGPHLHFGLAWRGLYFDPETLMAE